MFLILDWERSDECIMVLQHCKCYDETFSNKKMPRSSTSMVISDTALDLVCTLGTTVLNWNYIGNK